MRKIAVVTPVATGHHRDCVVEAMASAAEFPLHVVVLDGAGRVPDIPPGTHVTIIERPMMGRSAARNVGLRAAQAAGYPWCLFLDADDLFLPTTFADLQAAPEADIYYGESRLEDTGEQSWNHLPLNDKVRQQLAESPPRVKLVMANVEIMVRTDRALAIGGFDENLHNGEHFDFFVRYVLNPKIHAHMLRRPIVHVRRGLSSMRCGPWLDDAPERYAQWQNV
jgi:hypothetical protein